MDVISSTLRGPAQWAASHLTSNRHNPSIAGIPSQSPPAPRTRRALSDPPSPPTPEYLQPESPLFRLPPELRVQIFSYLVSDLTLPLTVSPSGHLQIYPYDPLCGELLARRVLSLLLACRRIYAEAIPLLYSTLTVRTFSSTAITFLPAILPSQRFKGTRVEFTWNLTEAPRLESQDKVWRGLNGGWREVWGALAAMKGLVGLKVVVEAEMGRWPQWSERERGLLAVVGEVGPWGVGGEFEATVNWPAGEKRGVGERLPCKIVRV